MIVELGLSVFFWGLALYSFVGLFSLIRVLIGAHRYDELERKAIFDAFAISMMIILIINLIQLRLSFVFPVEWKGFVSPGGFYNGGLISDSPLHFDSFLFDCSVIGICYMIRRYHYGLIRKRSIILPIIIFLLLLIGPFLVLLLLR